MPWEDPTLDTDEEGVITGILDGMADRLDGWEPVEGAPEVALAEELGREIAATNALAVEAMQLAIAGIGQTVFGLAPRTGLAATMEVTLDLRQGFVPNPDTTPTVVVTVTIPGGFTVIGDGVAFQTLADQTFDVTLTRSGPTVPYRPYVGSAQITVVATVPGTVGNLSPDTPLTVVTATPYVAGAILLDGGGSGGADEESLLDYLDRVTTYLSTLRPGGVRADDLAAFAKTISGVERAIGLDLYDPNIPLGGGSERTATIIPVNASGLPVSSPVRTELVAQLELVREVNFDFHVINPTYVALQVGAVLVAAPGVDKDDLDTRVTAALTAAISPARWGTTSEDPTAWVYPVTLTTLDLAGIVAQVPGVGSLTSLSLTGLNSDNQLGRINLPAPVAPGGSTVTVSVS